MKKLLSIISCCLIVIFCFAGCSASKKQVDEILAKQTNFATNQEQNLNLSADLFSNALKTEYSTYFSETQIANLETIVQCSNINISRLKSYLQIEEFTKKLEKNYAKDINKLNNNYYDNFANLISTKNSLEYVLTNGGQNTKKDYEKLNKIIYETINCGNLASRKLINFVKENLNAEISNEQIDIGSGVLELNVLDTLNNALSYYTQIYLNESKFKTFITYETQVINNIATINSILTTLNSCASSKFDLNSTNFVNLKNNILILQTYNKELDNEKDIFDKVINDFSYDNFKSSFEKSYPNEEFNSANVKLFVDENILDAQTKTNYKYLSTTIYSKINPTISTLNILITSINAL